MPTAAQVLDRSRTPYRRLTDSMADCFTPGDCIRAEDLKPLTNPELAVAVSHDEYIFLNAVDPSLYADILDSAIYLTEEAKARAFWDRLRIAVANSAAEALHNGVNDELCLRAEPVDVTLRAMDQAGHRATDFA